MAIFANGPGTQTSTVGTASGTVAIFSTSALTGTLRNLTIFNTGTISAYLGGGTAVTSATGLPLSPGQQVLIEGTVPTLYAVTGSGALTTTIVAGLATVASVD